MRTDLTANFRSPPRLVNAGNDLIENNDQQLEKVVHATEDRDTNPRLHALQGYNFYDYVRRVRRYTVDVVQQYQSQGAAASEIMVLCRFDNAVPYLDEIKDGLRSQGIPFAGKSDQFRGPEGDADDGVSVYSLYQAKGREAEHVILVHAAEGPYGFPPANRENELVEPVQPIPLGGIEEERRAFYVAITRSEHTLDLLTRAEQESQFLDEISEYTEAVEAGKVEPLDEVGEYMTATIKVFNSVNHGIKSTSGGFSRINTVDPPGLSHGKIPTHQRLTRANGTNCLMSELESIKTKRNWYSHSSVLLLLSQAVRVHLILRNFSNERRW